MHFFHLIQQSASHIYHSALPLSPRSSKFHSRTISEKTKVTKFDGRPDAWGIVVRTITTSSDHFKCMATFGHKIAAACDNGVVDIYDSVTGVLKLSLSLAHPVQAMRGSPDGSVLFCAHKTPSITVWDMQTGGLTHTLGLERNAEDIAVSSKGRYLACGLSDGSVKVLEVTNKMEGVTIWNRSPVTRFCWLEPEERLAVSTSGTVHIWDVFTGTVLRSCVVWCPVHHMIYSQKFDQLAIMASSTPNSSIAIINPQTGTSTPHSIRQNLSCIAFSQTAEEFVCGMETHGLQLFNISTWRLKHIECPGIMTSVSSLQNGTVVAKFSGSGIQLLSVDEGHALPQQPIVSALTVDFFDQDKIIAIFPTSRDHILLLELATMSQLLKIPIQKSNITPTDHITILCGSRENRMAVYCFEEGDKAFLQSWGFHEDVPRWTIKIDGVPEVGWISPAAAQLVTLHATDCSSRIYMWNAQTGQLDAQCTLSSKPPHIKFTSETEFYSDSNGLRTHYSLSLWGINAHTEQISPSLSKRSQERRYLKVDDTHEWVVSGFQRVCWIPPGYIGSIQPSYFWIGYSLVMVGQDGVLRKLTFSYDHPEE